MSRFIVMNAEQAAAVTGPSSQHANAELRPVMLKDGLRYVLPTDVLDSPVFPDRRALLAGYPQAEISADEFPSAPASAVGKAR